MIAMKLMDDSVGAAADTGSAVHKAIESMHHTGKAFDDCIMDATAAQSKYPKVDWNEVRLHFRGYFDDPRNTAAKILAYETQFKTQISEAGVDWTLQGTFDQIRLDKGRRMCYDIKTGSRCDAYETLMNHTLQLAAYWIGAETLGYSLDGVGIIYTYGYRKRGAELPSPTGVFLPHPMSRSDCTLLMKGVSRRIQSIRNGEIDIVPGTHCNVCPARSVSVCIPLYKEKF